MTMRSLKDFGAGVLFIAFGGAFAVIARNYRMGSAVRMGPAYFPTILGVLLVVLGVVILLRSFRVAGSRPNLGRLRPLAFVLASMLAFALLLERLGLVATTISLVVLSRLGGEDVRPGHTVALAIGLAALALGLFVFGLRLPLKVWP